MNIRNLEMLDKFRTFVNEKSGYEQAADETARLHCIMEAENMEVCDLLERARRMMLIGFEGTKPKSRPVVYDHPDLSAQVCWFPKLDLADDIVAMQDVIDVVASVKREFGTIVTNHDECDLEESYDTVVYGAGIQKGKKLAPHLTVAEVISQICCDDEMQAFCVVSGAQDDEYLTPFGYHAYKVKVFTVKYPAEIKQSIPMVMGYNSADIDLI